MLSSSSEGGGSPLDAVKSGFSLRMMVEVLEVDPEQPLAACVDATERPTPGILCAGRHAAMDGRVCLSEVVHGVEVDVLSSCGDARAAARAAGLCAT